jgi:serine protease AprX
MDLGRLGRCRERLISALGTEAARKATDDFCIAFGSHEGIIERAHAVVELQPVPWTLPPFDETVQRFRESLDLGRAREFVCRAFGDFEEDYLRRGTGASLNAVDVIRSVYIHVLKEAAMAVALPIRYELEHNSPSSPPDNGESTTQICWLNQTLRTWASLRALADVAADPAVARIDVPRTLAAEIGRTGVVVGAVQHRAQFGHTGKGVIVAVIDHEVDHRHSAFQGRVKQTENFTTEPWGSPSRHGTAVAGIIAANGKLLGMAPDAEIHNYKVLTKDAPENGEEFDGVLALEHALENHARIANCSWGTRAVTDGTSREARAVDNAWRCGMTVVKSAGNLGPGKNTLTSPADADGVIVVGATDREGTGVEDYSSRGTTVNGKNPHMVAPGGTRGVGARGIDSCRNGTFQDCGWGTSLAAPHVSGVLAVMLEMHPDLTPNEQRARLLSLCKPLGTSVEAEGSGLVSIELLT